MGISIFHASLGENARRDRVPAPGETLTRRFGVEWVTRDDGHGFEIEGISGEMMHVFSSRRESITVPGDAGGSGEPDAGGRAQRADERARHPRTLGRHSRGQQLRGTELP